MSGRHARPPAPKNRNIRLVIAAWALFIGIIYTLGHHGTVGLLTAQAPSWHGTMRSRVIQSVYDDVYGCVYGQVYPGASGVDHGDSDDQIDISVYLNQVPPLSPPSVINQAYGN